MIVWIPGAIIQWWLEKKLPPPPLVDYTEEWRKFRNDICALAFRHGRERL